MTLRIQCWSGPRNISTALMYSWRQRRDTTVVDEPFYAHYLAGGDRGHPAADLVIESQSTDAEQVIGDVILGPVDTPVLYVKNMAHHLAGVDRRHLADTTNILLIREPRSMVASLAVQLPDCTLADTGLATSVELLDAIVSEGGTPIVIDGDAVLADPPRMLAALCSTVGLEFDPIVLAWPMGPKPEDGVWAPHWYESVHSSTGFGRPRTTPRPLPRHLQSVVAEAMPLYERLRSHQLDA